jgi:KH/beta-lactamase-domain protein
VGTSFNEIQTRIREAILGYVPKEAEITRIEFEGPKLAIYAKRPEILFEQSYIVTDMVNRIRKRVVIRSDPSVRLDERETENAVKQLVPPEAEVTNVTFDPTVGEVVIEAKKPGLVIGKDGITLQKIVGATRWRPRVLRSPPLPSMIIAHIRHYLHSEAKERERIMRDVGERIFRPTFLKSNEVLLTTLGGFREVGRSSMLVRTKESSVLLDCGMNPAYMDSSEAFPKFNVDEFDLDTLDAVIISHAHLDHCGLLPFLFKYGFDGPVYCSEPTSSLMTLLQLDSLDVLTKSGRQTPYDQKDVRETVLHTIPLKYGTVTDISPDMRLTLHNAGHILGSSIVHLHIGEGLHKIVYTGHLKFGHTMLLDPAVMTFPRIETLITESTYGAPEDIMPSRKEVEEKLAFIVNRTIEGGGRVLIPVPAVGRAQEIMLVLDSYMRQGLMREVPVYIEGMISEATAIHTAYPEYLSREVRDRIIKEGINPFQSDYFTVIESSNARAQIDESSPSITLATSGMLEGGPSIEWFKMLAPNPLNTVIFVSYQIEGTTGRRLLRGNRDFNMLNNEGRTEAFKVECAVDAVEGFSGHSDRNQIFGYARKILPHPDLIIVNHGESKKCLGVANTFKKVLKINAIAPQNLETIRLK